MRYLKMLLLMVVAVLTFGSAVAQVEVNAHIGPRHHHHWHHRYWRHHHWVYR
jgi:hypothetical protein